MAHMARRKEAGLETGRGYRTYLSAGLMGIAVLARQMGWLSPEQANMVYEVFLAAGLAFLRASRLDPPRRRKRKPGVTT